MKIIVAHPEQQHSYRLATALEKQGILQSYITTVYYNKYNLTWLASRILSGALKTRAMDVINGNYNA